MRSFLCLLLTGLLAVEAAGQAQAPVVRVTTRLVQVNVIVRDKKGEPVTGLKREDFVLQDNGKDQPIRLFAMESVKAAKSATARPANLFTNRPDLDAEIPSLTVILIDGLNTRIEDQIYAKAQLTKFLQQLAPSDRVALYTMGGRLRLIHDFSNDTASLLKTVASYQTTGSRSIEAARAEEPAIRVEARDPFAATMQQFANGMQEALEATANLYTATRIVDSLRAIEGIANRLAGVPGRKSLIWLSGGFPLRIGLSNAGLNINYRNFAPDMERTSRAVSNANLAIYPVDARGLMTPQGASESLSAASTAGAVRNPNLGPAIRPGTPGIDLAGRIEEQASNAALDARFTMNELAERTGGRAFYETNDINRAIRRAVDDGQVSYVLAYAPNHEQWNGQFRELKVKVNKPGLEIQHRRGYIAFPEEKHDDNDRRAALGKAASSPVTSSVLGLKVRYIPGPQPEAPITLGLEMDPKEIGFEQKEGRYAGFLDLFFVMRTAEGQVLLSEHQPADLTLAPKDYESMLKTGIGISARFQMPPSTAQIRVVVRDMATGAVGSLDIPVKK